MFSFQDCTKYFCLDIQNKMNVLEKSYLLVRTLDINDDEKEEKVCVISTNFIRKLTDLFFIIIGEKDSMTIPLNKMSYLRKMSKLTCLCGPMYLPLDDYPPYYDKQSIIFEANINKEFRCIHGYINHVEHNVFITWVSINSWENYFLDFPKKFTYILVPGKFSVMCVK